VSKGPIDDSNIVSKTISNLLDNPPAQWAPGNPFRAKLPRPVSFIHSKCVDAEFIKGVHVYSSQTPRPAWTFQPVALSATAGACRGMFYGTLSPCPFFFECV
jgi:hypothetical protein